MQQIIANNKEVYFLGEVLPMKVQVFSDNYAICTRKLDKNVDASLIQHQVTNLAYLTFKEAWNDLKNEVVYTIIHFESEIKGPHDLLFNTIDFTSKKSMEALLYNLDNNKISLSKRHSKKFSFDLKKMS